MKTTIPFHDAFIISNMKFMNDFSNPPQKLYSCVVIFNNIEYNIYITKDNLGYFSISSEGVDLTILFYEAYSIYSKPNKKGWDDFNLFNEARSIITKFAQENNI